MSSNNIQSKHGLDIHGITNTDTVYWNLSNDDLVKISLERKEGELTATGALSCTTGEHTGRSPKDKFIVKDATTENKVDWGSVNVAMSPEHFAQLRDDQRAYLQGKTLFVRDAFGGNDKNVRIPIRVINESAWTNLFASHLFVRPEEKELENHLPQFTIIHTPGFCANPEVHGTKTKTFIVVNFTEGLILIGGTEYAGEMKKSIFSILNFLYPLQGILPMHCSANMSEDKSNTALFFGLSGTGKTTLSADPHRKLIGDDEHGWSDYGVFNFEGGCYAKAIDLTEEKEPEIFRAIRDGAILENVVLDANKNPDYKNVSLTENTRAAYPIHYIDNAELSGIGGHPNTIVFLTCDAFGVMPPISKLTPEQAMYHFLSGYTAKVAGTEKGMGNEPSATFSACFGSPFLPLKPTTYAKMLGEKMKEHNASCWLVNTGWVGGQYGVGNRIKLSYTRRMVNAAINGELDNVECTIDPIFGLAIPKAIEGIPSEVLNARALWADANAYDAQANKLVELFSNNFKKFDANDLTIGDMMKPGKLVANG